MGGEEEVYTVVIYFGEELLTSLGSQGRGESRYSLSSCRTSIFRISTMAALVSFESLSVLCSKVPISTY